MYREVILEAVYHGDRKAMRGDRSIDNLIEESADPGVSDEALLFQLTGHCLRFGVTPHSREAICLIRLIQKVRPEFGRGLKNR